MAWRNCPQAITATIPQLMLTDANADAFMQALIAAGSSTQAKTAVYNTYIKPLLLNTYCQTNDLVSEKIAGENTNYINCTVEGNFANFYFYYNNTQQTQPLLTQSKMNNWVCAYVALVDDENQVGFWQGFTILITNPLNTGTFGGTQPVYSGESANRVYSILTGNEYHQYTWQSVPAISGETGSKGLAIVNSEIIGDGVTVTTNTDASNFTLPNSAKLYNYLQNLADGVETTVMYCGDNYLTLTRETVETSSGLTITAMLKLYSSMGILYYSHRIAGYYRGSNQVDNEYLGFYIDDENEVALLGTVIDHYYEGSQVYRQYQYNNYGDATEAQMRNIYSWLSGHIVPETDPYDWGSEDNGGEDGTLTPQDDLPSNGLPSVDGMNTGMFTVWLVDDTVMVHISNFLWSDNVIDNIKKYFNSVGDCVLGMYVLPYVPTTGIGSKKFQIGNMVDSDYPNVDYLTSRYRTEDMGSFDVSAVWDTYLDFAPYSKLEIFLPYCGLHQLDIDEFMCPADKDGKLQKSTGSSVNCEYRIDLLTGGVVVYLKQGGNVKYQFSGKMGCNLPVTGNNYSMMVQTMIQGISGLASTVASKAISAPYAQNPQAPVASPELMSGSASQRDINKYNKAQAEYDKQMSSRATQLGHSVGSATGAAVSGTVQSMKPDIIRCGNISGDLSMIGYDRPYLIKTRPNKPKLEGQKDFTGLPSYKKGTVGSFSGYTEFIKVHIDDVPCTGNEKDAIESILHGGVIIQKGTATPDPQPVVEGKLCVVLMKMKSETIVLGKTWTDEHTVEGRLIYDNSVNAPVILIDGDCTGYNYVYLPFFHRFYYIEDYVVTKENMQEVHLKIDPLQSFKEDIVNCTGIVSRSASDPNYYINDGVFYTEQRQVVTYHCFKKDGQIKKFDTQQIYFITAGGG